MKPNLTPRPPTNEELDHLIERMEAITLPSARPENQRFVAARLRFFIKQRGLDEEERRMMMLPPL